jgi:glycosyltransferase involved in cell wall biosynthesis
MREKAAESGLELFVYVVDDGSMDNTARLARDAGAHRIVRHRVNQGLGAAVRTGIAAAAADDADILVKFDADLQHNPNDLLSIVQPILQDEADVVYGDRFGRIEYRMPFVRKAGNIVFTGLMRWLTKWPLRDSQPGIFAVNRAYLDVCYLPGDYNYTQQILLDAYHKGMRFAHVPVAFRKRVTGKSFVSLKYPFRVLPQIVIALAGLKPMRIFAPIGLLFIGIATVVFVWEMSEWVMGKAAKPVEHVNAVLGFAFFGFQTLCFGILAELIVRFHRKQK